MTSIVTLASSLRSIDLTRQLWRLLTPRSLLRFMTIFDVFKNSKKVEKIFGKNQRKRHYNLASIVSSTFVNLSQLTSFIWKHQILDRLYMKILLYSQDIAYYIIGILYYILIILKCATNESFFVLSSLYKAVNKLVQCFK